MLARCIIDGVPIRQLHEIEATLPRIRLDDVVATSPTHTPTQLNVINQLHQGSSAGNNVTTGDDQAGNTILDDLCRTIRIADDRWQSTGSRLDNRHSASSRIQGRYGGKDVHTAQGNL